MMHRLRAALATFTVAFTLASCTRLPAQSASNAAAPDLSLVALPPAAPPAWRGLIGEYDTPLGERLVLEDAGRLMLGDTIAARTALSGGSSDEFAIDPAAAQTIAGRAANRISFARDASGRATAALLGDTRLPRRAIEPLPGTTQLRLTPLHPVSELRAEALAASPPRESGPFRPSDLVEVTTLDSTIHLEIRYATTNNFLGTRFYDEPRAFLQRPAAEAVVRANRALRRIGYGLLIHDAYRPWFVTKMFWDATPDDKKWLVADPSRGSLHNRGAAVDLTLFDLATGAPVEMPSTYDESTDRAHADYPGGTSRQRALRALLRRAMEAQGFTVLPTEWWHFDYKDWREYAIGNAPFDRLGR
jgi:D-alanyl-D-alanine dipeptidase